MPAQGSTDAGASFAIGTLIPGTYRVVARLSQGPIAPVGTVNSGEAFAPIKSKQYEVGAKLDFGTLSATISLFQIEQPSGQTDTAANRYSLDGETRNCGVEFNLFGEVTTGLRLLGGVAFMDGVQTKTYTWVSRYVASGLVLLAGLIVMAVGLAGA